MKRKHWKKELINLVIVGTGVLFTDKAATSVNRAGSTIRAGKDTKVEQATSCRYFMFKLIALKHFHHVDYIFIFSQKTPLFFHNHVNRLSAYSKLHNLLVVTAYRKNSKRNI